MGRKKRSSKTLNLMKVLKNKDLKKKMLFGLETRTLRGYLSAVNFRVIASMNFGNTKT